MRLSWPAQDGSGRRCFIIWECTRDFQFVFSGSAQEFVEELPPLNGTPRELGDERAVRETMGLLGKVVEEFAKEDEEKGERVRPLRRNFPRVPPKWQECQLDIVDTHAFLLVSTPVASHTCEFLLAFKGENLTLVTAYNANLGFDAYTARKAAGDEIKPPYYRRISPPKEVVEEKAFHCSGVKGGPSKRPCGAQKAAHGKGFNCICGAVFCSQNCKDTHKCGGGEAGGGGEGGGGKAGGGSGCK